MRKTGIGNATVLVVDDDDCVVAAIATLLNGSVKEMVICRSFAKAERWLQETPNPCDVALVDLKLDDGWGLDLCDGLLAAPNHCAGYVVMSELPKSESHIRLAYRTGADEYLPKPFERSQLIAALATALARTMRYRRRLEDQPLAAGPVTPSSAASEIDDRLRTARRVYMLDDVEALIVRGIVVDELADKELETVTGKSLSGVKRIESSIRHRIGVKTRVGLARAVMSLPPSRD